MEMRAGEGREEEARPTLLAPFGYATFRMIWIASLFSNLGYLIQTVGAAWAMTELAGAADMVALVQTAAMAPMMIFALSAGAVADTYDRRRIGLAGIGIATVGATLLTLCAWAGLLSPTLILAFTFLIGTGIALFAPAWQASVPEMVPLTHLPAAISLNSISFNIARSFGPAIGGVIVAAAGATAAFLVNALFFLPMIAALLLWKRKQEPPRLPPESLLRAIVSGVRYAFHSPPIRTVLGRALIIGTLGCVLAALMPLIARDLLHGDAQTFGLTLGAFGVGAVLGALSISKVIARVGLEHAMRYCTLAIAGSCVAIGMSASLIFTAAMLMVAGASWMISVTILNIVLQTAAPRWVAGRALAAFQTAVAGGVAIGSWGWGHIANSIAVDGALLVAGGALALSLVAAWWLRLPQKLDPVGDEPDPFGAPSVNLAITDRSGPIVVEIEYRVARDDARAFHGMMQHMQFIRRRTGAYAWSIARDLAEPEIWVERFHCPTWLDYLRQRSRHTQADRDVMAKTFAYNMEGHNPVVRRMLERPFGSVRWREDVRDNAEPPLLQSVSGAGSP